MPPGRNGKTNMLDIETLIISRQIQNRNLGQYLNLSTDSYIGVSNFRTKYLIDDKETYPRYLEILENAKSELDSRNDALCQNVSEIEAFIFADADGGIFNKVLNKSLRESEF